MKLGGRHFKWYKCSMEYWTLESPNKKKTSSSTGFHGIRRVPLQMTQVFHGIPWNIPWNSMELWCRQMKYHLVPWNSMVLWDCHFMTCYPGLPRDIPWNSVELWSRQIKKSPSSMGFHGIRRAPFQMTQVFNEIQWNITWNSMELWCRQMKYHLVPWNSRKYSMEFHGTLVPPNEASLNSMEFHGTLRLSFYGMLPWTSKGYSMEIWSRQIKNHRVPWDSREIGRRHFKWDKVFHGIPWNSGARQMKYHLVPWNSMEYSMEFHGTLVLPNEVSLNSMEFHGTLWLSFYGMLPWTSKGYSMEFHWTLESTNRKSSSSMGFHGIRRAPFQMTQSVPWNSIE